MIRRIQFGLLILIAALVTGIVITWRLSEAPTAATASVAAKASVDAPPGEVGSVVPEFSVTDIHGRTMTSEDLRGKVLLVDYWSTWCKPCEKEMPGYQRLQEKYRDREFIVIGIAFDGNMKMGDETVEHYATRLKIEYPLVLDLPQLQKNFGSIQGLPTTFLIDRNRKIRFKVVGFEYAEKIEAALLGLL